MSDKRGKEKLHIFEVGIMSDAAKIEAPTAEAAAIFYQYRREYAIRRGGLYDGRRRI